MLNLRHKIYRYINYISCKICVIIYIKSVATKSISILCMMYLYLHSYCADTLFSVYIFYQESRATWMLTELVFVLCTAQSHKYDTKTLDYQSQPLDNPLQNIFHWCNKSIMNISLFYFSSLLKLEIWPFNLYNRRIYIQSKVGNDIWTIWEGTN